MIEDLNDIISLILLFSLPVTVFIISISKLFRHKKEKVLTTSEKFYREW